MERGDIVKMSKEAVEQEIPGCLCVPPFTGEVLSVWETDDGGKFVDVKNDHDHVNLLHETTYHQDFVRVV
jgi:hypothetical protein